MLFFEMVIYKLIIMTLLQHILEKNYTKVHYTVMTASLFFLHIHRNEENSQS